MRRIPLYKQLTESYFNGKENDELIPDDVPDSLKKYKYQFMITIYGNQKAYLSKINTQWKNFLKFMIRALKHYEIIDSESSITDVNLFSIRRNDNPQKLDINDGYTIKNTLSHDTVRVCLVYDITGYLLYDITSDDFIQQEDAISHSIGKAFEKMNATNIKVSCGIGLDYNNCKDAINNRLDISTISDTRLNNLHFQNTLSDRTLDGVEVPVNKQFTYKDLSSCSYTYNITLYRLLKRSVITSDYSYSMTYEVEDDMIDASDFDEHKLINNDKKKTKKLLEDIIERLKTSLHNSRMWLYTSRSNQYLHLTLATDIVITYNDERYIVNIETLITRSKSASGYSPNKPLSATDLKITNKFIDICQSLGNNKDEVIDELIEMKAVPLNFKR